MPAGSGDIEAFIISRLAAGDWADLRDVPNAEADVRPVLSGAFIRNLLLGLEPRLSSLPTGVRIRAAHVEGRLDLADCVGAGGSGLGVLALEDCDLTDRIDVSNAEFTRLSIRRSRFREIWGEAVHIRGDFEFRDASPYSVDDEEATAYIRLRAARIGGDVWGRGARLQAPEQVPDGLNAIPPCLNLWLAQVGGSVMLDGGASMVGGVNLSDAQIGGSLECDGSRFSHVGAEVLTARAARVGGSVSFLPMGGVRFEADGEIGLRAAVIGGSVTFIGASLSSITEDALDVSSAKIEGGLVLNPSMDHPLEVNGRILMGGVSLAGDLDLEGASLIRASGQTINADSARIGGGILMRSVAGSRFQSEGQIWLRGMTVGGNLEIRGARIVCPEEGAMNATGISVSGSVIMNPTEEDACEFEGEVNLRRAHITGDLDCDGLLLMSPDGTALTCDAARIEGAALFAPMEGRRFDAQGRVWLRGASIGGAVSFRGARVTNARGLAVNATSVTVGESIRFHQHEDFRFEAEGEVSLSGAQVGANVEMSGVRLHNPEGLALDAAGAEIDGDLAIMPSGDQLFEADGVISLMSAEIGGDVRIGSGRITGSDGTALQAGGVTIQGDLILAGYGEMKLTIDGEAVIRTSEIKGEVYISNVKISRPSGTALDATSVQISTSLQASDNDIEGVVDFQAATIGLMGEEPHTAWRGARRVVLDEATYQHIAVERSDGPVWKARRDLLRRNSYRDGYGRLVAPTQPWRECASAFLRSGSYQDARRILREGYREANRARPLWRRVFVWAFAEAPFGFGLSVVRATVVAVVFWMAGWAGAHYMLHRGVLVESGGEGPCTSSSPGLYALDTAIPFIDLRQESACDPGDAGLAQLMPAGEVRLPALSVPGSDIRTPSLSLGLPDEVALWRWGKAVYALLGAFVLGFAAVTYSGVFNPRE